MNTKITPRDFFLHLGATVALYAAVIALINLALSVINYAVPDKLAGYFYANSIAWPISMLLVLIPLLYVLEWVILRDIARASEKGEFWIRRWRIYLTLFLSGATIVGDLIALINTYLSGEITMRFAYKILAILVICGVVFVYYMLNRKNDVAVAKLRKAFAAAGLVLVLAAVVGGFIAVGSPWKQRAIRFDNQRLNDLTTIQSQIIYSYWSQKGSLPKTLADLNDPISSYMVPVDPATDAAYEYAAKGKLSFELCATFDLPSQDDKGRGAYGAGGGINYASETVSSYPYPGGTADSWKHEAGRACFQRTIDPDKYPVNRKMVPPIAPSAAAEPVAAPEAI